jgi:hypothetical protein
MSEKRRSSTRHTRRRPASRAIGKKSDAVSSSDAPDVTRDSAQMEDVAADPLDILASSLLGLQRGIDTALMLVSLLKMERAGNVLRRVDGRPFTQDDAKRLIREVRGEAPKEAPRFFGDAKTRGDTETHDGE